MQPSGPHAWRWLTIEQFLKAYREGRWRVARPPPPTQPSSAALLDLFPDPERRPTRSSMKLANRPAWVDIPLTGLVSLLTGEDEA